MPVYDVQQYEVHAVTYRVSAANPAEAVKKVLNGEGWSIDNSQEFIEVADMYGMPVERLGENLDWPTLQAQIIEAGLDCTSPDDCVDSIREVELFEGDVEINDDEAD